MAPRQRNVKEKGKSDGKNSNKSPRREKESDSTKTESQEQATTAFQMPWRKIFMRFLLSILLVFAVYWTSNKDLQNVLAKRDETVQLKTQEVTCSAAYKNEIMKFEGCAPKQCGRLVTDVIVSPQEAAQLLQLCKKGLALGGSSGGASILDLHSGALSHGNSFINIYQKIKASGKNNVFFAQDFAIYKNVRNKVQQMVAFNFGIPASTLHLTHPTFFSKMTNRPAKTKHDEYWHVHVDKETYPSFHYTSLLYLADYNVDFTGGRFMFVEKTYNVTIEPRIGRVSVFTSGAENPHFVEPVESGTRYALTMSFTCDPKFAITDPSIEKIQ